MSETIFECRTCGKRISVPSGKPAPSCCGAVMAVPEPLPYCTAAPDAEQSRSHRSDGPCDDGTLPKK